MGAPGPGTALSASPILVQVDLGGKDGFQVSVSSLRTEQAKGSGCEPACLLSGEKRPVSQETDAELPRGQMTIVRMPQY